MMDYKNLIMNSKSVRSFKEKEVEAKNLEEIKKYIEIAKVLVPGIETELKFYDKGEVYDKMEGLAGYNGFLIDAPHYMLLLSDKKDNYIENAGYIAENARLKGVELKIDSCWITFNDGKKILENIGIVTDKELVALVAFGYADEAKKKVLKATKTGENYSQSEMEKAMAEPASDRKAIEEIVFMDKWGQAADIEDLETRALLDAFSYARLAPSALNKQPWRFIVDGGKIVLVVDKEELKDEYEGKIASGIVMLYFGLIVDTTLMDSKWVFDASGYEVPAEYRVVGYCNI